MALGTLLRPTGIGWVKPGIALFLASDLILALRLFRLKDETTRLRASRALWPAYWGGQALILWGV